MANSSSKANALYIGLSFATLLVAVLFFSLALYYRSLFIQYLPGWSLYAVSLAAWVTLLCFACQVQWCKRIVKWGWIIGSAFCLALLPTIAAKLSSPYHWHRIFLTDSMLYRVDTQQPIVALTFDDGPVTGKTERLLDVLKKHNAHATFFLQGANIAQNKAVIQRMLEEGHSVGNHTWSHTRIDNLSDAELSHELQQTNDAIVGITGQPNELMRPPGGTMDPHQGSLVADCLHYEICMWSIQSNDTRYHGQSPTDIIVPETMKRIQSGDILLMHDQAISPETLDALLSELSKKGLRGVTVPELKAAGGQICSHPR